MPPLLHHQSKCKKEALAVKHRHTFVSKGLFVPFLQKRKIACKMLKMQIVPNWSVIYKSERKPFQFLKKKLTVYIWPGFYKFDLSYGNDKLSKDSLSSLAKKVLENAFLVRKWLNFRVQYLSKRQNEKKAIVKYKTRMIQTKSFFQV